MTTSVTSRERQQDQRQEAQSVCSEYKLKIISNKTRCVIETQFRSIIVCNYTRMAEMVDVDEKWFEVFTPGRLCILGTI